MKLVWVTVRVEGMIGRWRSGSVLLVLALLLPVSTADPNPDALRPAAATAALFGSATVVSWIPGQEVASAFNVYGIDATGNRVLIESVAAPQTSFLVPPEDAYQAFAVTGSVGTIESEPAMATALYLCSIYITLFPPNVGGSCRPSIEFSLAAPTASASGFFLFALT